VRRITGDPGLEPQRKDYLVQHIMASRYVVAQQMRLEDAVVTPSSDPARTFAAKCVTGPYMLCSAKQAGISRSVRSPTARLSGTVLIMYNTWLCCTVQLHVAVCAAVSWAADTTSGSVRWWRPAATGRTHVVNATMRQSPTTRWTPRRSILWSAWTATRGSTLHVRLCVFPSPSAPPQQICLPASSGRCDTIITADLSIEYCRAQVIAATAEQLWRHTTAASVICGTTTAQTRSTTVPTATCAARGRGWAWTHATAWSATRACTWPTSLGTAAGSSTRAPSARRTCTRAPSLTGYVIVPVPGIGSASQCMSAAPGKLVLVWYAKLSMTVCATGAASVRALYALALLQAAHAGILHVPAVPEIPRRHDSVLSGMAALPVRFLRSLHSLCRSTS